MTKHCKFLTAFASRTSSYEVYPSLSSHSPVMDLLHLFTLGNFLRQYSLVFSLTLFLKALLLAAQSVVKPCQTSHHDLMGH